MENKIGLVEKFVKAGKAIFTIKNEETGNRYTFKVKKLDDKDIYFVSVLNGSDNYANYKYIGSIFNNTFKLTKNSKANKDDTSFKAFDWFYRMMINNKLPEKLSVYHEGKCGRCGRRLTVPESIESGFGPECIQHII